MPAAVPAVRCAEPFAFRSVEPARDAADALSTPCRPRVVRGLAATWPAVQKWSFPYLAARGRGMPVRLVLGDRELQATRFAVSTLDAYLDRLEHAPADDPAPAYLKEFNLLASLPALQADLMLDTLFPSGRWVWNDAWIGPRGARTGLHRDRLDNLAVLLRGRKRFRLAPPGSVEALGARSRKYDRVSVMAVEGLEALAARAPALPVHEVELAPGDALFTPAGWWHEVLNLDASVFIGGFFGGRIEVSAKWLATLPAHLLHRAGLWRRGQCTCHA